jgi:hypothetical protein
MQQVVSAIVGTTASGRLRYSGCICCSTEAKKLFRSICRKPNRSGWEGVSGIRNLNYFIRFLFAVERSIGRDIQKPLRGSGLTGAPARSAAAMTSAAAAAEPAAEPASESSAPVLERSGCLAGPATARWAIPPEHTVAADLQASPGCAAHPASAADSCGTGAAPAADPSSTGLPAPAAAAQATNHRCLSPSRLRSQPVAAFPGPARDSVAPFAIFAEPAAGHASEPAATWPSSCLPSPALESSPVPLGSFQPAGDSY